MVDLILNNDRIKNIKLVIFDKDGTLLDLYTYWANMIDMRVDFARDELGFTEGQKEYVMYKMGVDLKNKRLRPEGPVGLKKREIVMEAMIEALEKNGFPGKEDLCRKAFTNTDRASMSRLHVFIKPIIGMDELLTELKNKKCKVAIATTDRTDRAKLAAEFLGIRNKIDMIIGEDAVCNYKPSPDMVNLILKELSVSKENAVMIGDAVSDVEMGHNAGLAASIGVLSGLTPKKSLLEKTKYVVGDISEIKISRIKT